MGTFDFEKKISTFFSMDFDQKSLETKSISNEKAAKFVQEFIENETTYDAVPPHVKQLFADFIDATNQDKSISVTPIDNTIVETESNSTEKVNSESKSNSKKHIKFD